MERRRKKIFFILIPVLIVVITAVIVLSVNFGPMLFMKPAETAKTNFGVYVIKDNKNNVFLLESEDGYIAIDAGSDINSFKKGLEQFGINVSDIKHVLLTHTDYDHVAALGLLSSAQVYMSEDETQMIDGSKKRSAFKRNSLPDGINAESIHLLSSQELTLGGYKIECIKTPGHTLGSMTFLFDDKYIFTGDAVRVKKNNFKLHPFAMDKKMSKGSMDNISGMTKNAEYVFTAHYGYYNAADLKQD